MERLTMRPAPGECLLRFVGDTVCFRLEGAGPGGSAFLRTNLGKAAALRAETLRDHYQQVSISEHKFSTLNPILPGASWRDIPMRRGEGGWEIELSVAEVGYFSAKAYWVDAKGRQHWPSGPNAGVTVHPNLYRTANTVYCAFTRMFGETKTVFDTANKGLDAQFAQLDKLGHTVIPPSGKLRDLQRELPHIFGALGCKILHLLPVNPTPTTYARFGRYGSPYACEDLTAIDPALVEFDRRTTGVDQFRELTEAVHLLGGRVFLDVVINHTGWGSTLQENHPEWFLKDSHGTFESPGAWGTVWEDLVELDHRVPVSWESLADTFLTWVRRGVDGFRCDAGYKVPPAAWKYIVACVRREFPDTLFLLEGLGGAWEATETLLREGGMQWAYSELFQNYSGLQVSGYLDHSHKQSATTGVLIHYSETHDNERLSARGKLWSRMRNQLCALTSSNGAFGFTCGVEWLAPERINVHSCRGLAWGNPENIVDDLAKLNGLLADHPCFFDGAKLTRLSAPTSAVYALRRDSAEGLDRVLVLVNLDIDAPQKVALDSETLSELGAPLLDLLGNNLPNSTRVEGNRTEFLLPPGASYCLAASATPRGLAGDAYRRKRAQAAFALAAIGHVVPPESVGPYSWLDLADRAERDSARLLAGIQRLPRGGWKGDLAAELDREPGAYPAVVVWREADLSRAVLIPPDHWLLVELDRPFRASVVIEGAPPARHAESIPTSSGHVACFPPIAPGRSKVPRAAALSIESHGQRAHRFEAPLRFLAAQARCAQVHSFSSKIKPGVDPESPLVLLTNGIGGMARMCVDLGAVKSKYDCALAANLHPSVPVDRHVLAKRVRVWVNANRFITPLDARNLVSFSAGPPARWTFGASAGNGQAVEIELTADMCQGENATIFRFRCSRTAVSLGEPLAPDAEVRLTVRVDIEDRGFHGETKRNGGAEHHFHSHSRPLPGRPGFEFAPAADRALRVYASAGDYHHEAEWSEGLRHSVEQTRGQVGSGDAFSPGWFDIPLAGESFAYLVAEAGSSRVESRLPGFALDREAANEAAIRCSNFPPEDTFGRQLAVAAQAYVVRRGDFKTVIAGYPWFLDWGRDSLICARGLVAAGMLTEVRDLLCTFGRFEADGTLPNSIHGDDASNRETSDAPLWFGVVCEELAAKFGPGLYDLAVEQGGRTVRAVLHDLAIGYFNGAPNGIRMDPASGLIWSPSHFTWMDTNYPAGTPREGYPVEIQVLWIALLRQLVRLKPDRTEPIWKPVLQKAEASFRERFWLADKGYLADLLRAGKGVSAADAVVDDALRPNCLFAVTFGLVDGARSRSCVQAVARHLVVPGAVRSLAPLPVSVPLPVYSPSGQLLNNPSSPYFGRYEGDEDTRRKPAYHNGTAWTWPFPTFCEALAKAYDNSPAALAAARAYLGSMEALLNEGCIGHIPEILDGDHPHLQRGCDAQAWGVTEALRVWELLSCPAPDSAGSVQTA